MHRTSFSGSREDLTESQMKLKREMKLRTKVNTLQKRRNFHLKAGEIWWQKKSSLLSSNQLSFLLLCGDKIERYGGKHHLSFTSKTNSRLVSKNHSQILVPFGITSMLYLGTFRVIMTLTSVLFSVRMISRSAFAHFDRSIYMGYD